MRTYLIAVVAPDELAVHEFLLASPLGPGKGDSPIDSWWVAEDDRQDRSDNDSAIFVPRGSQDDVSSVVDQWFEHKREEWAETGYPYAETDVSGAWFTDPWART